jgi:hypothetical protein
MSRARTFDSLRTVRQAEPKPEIDADLFATFTTASGKKVLQWLWEQNVISQVPMMAEERAYREAEGKKRLVLDLIRRVEEFDSVPDGKPTADTRPAKR